jgi:hypothetical protein
VRGVEASLFLVVLGTVVAAFAGRLRVTAPSLLVIAGLVVGLLPGFPPVHVTPDVVSPVVLPPVLHAARWMSQSTTPGLVMICGFCLMLGRTGPAGIAPGGFLSSRRTGRRQAPEA